jgi:hypothetical protein
MKRVLLCLGMGATLLVSSCKKDVGGLAENTWLVSGKLFTATNVAASSATNYISAADGNGSSLDFSFKSLPTGNTNYTVNDVAYTDQDVAIRAVLGGSLVYNSIDNKGGYVIARASNGNYTLIMNDIKMVNASSSKDTVTVSAYLVNLVK